MDGFVGRWGGLMIAILCSLLLTGLTVTPPPIPADWARLDAAGVYVPPEIVYAWSGYGVQAVLWLGMAGGLIAFSRQPSAVRQFNHRDTEDIDRAAEKTASGFRIYGLLVVIILVGLWLRVRGLERLPLIIDEIGFAAKASDILHGQQVPIFAPGHNANPSVYSWLVSGSMSVWEQTRFAMRLIPLAFGVLSIPAVYLLGRVWFGRRVGLLAAAFLATYPAHIFFSRLSLYNIVDPFFAMLALVYIRKAGGQTRLAVSPQGHSVVRYAVMAGLWAGVAQYFYHGSRLLLVLMGVYILWSAIGKAAQKQIQESALRTVGTTHVSSAQETGRSSVSSQAAEEKRNETSTIYFAPTIRWNVFWMVAAFMVMTLPRFAPMMLSGLPVTGNIEGWRLPADFGANAVRAVLAWVGQPDVSPFWLGEGRLLEWGVLLFFMVGMVVCLRRWFDARYAVLVVSVVLTTVFGGAIWTAAPLYVRYMTAVPAIALLVGLGLEKINSITQRHEGTKTRSNRGGRLQAVVIGVVMVQGLIGALGHIEEAAGRVSESQWLEDRLAWEARTLANGIGAVMVVPGDFGAVQMITIADYVTVYGERRAIAVNKKGLQDIDEQGYRLGKGYEIVDISE